ncbi:DUF2188 domain-containing protein [Salibacterium halotolerans]|uniref:DUF2188 domain-containing protein n=1 Tax=Salibacterium halotolerans TaxID=1884432 RepID=UPI003CC7ABB7
MITGRDQHVFPHENGWQVKGEMNQNATSVHNTLNKAIDAARGIAEKHCADVVIHHRDITMRYRDARPKPVYTPE